MIYKEEGRIHPFAYLSGNSTAADFLFPDLLKYVDGRKICTPPPFLSMNFELIFSNMISTFEQVWIPA